MLFDINDIKNETEEDKAKLEKIRILSLKPSLKEEDQQKSLKKANFLKFLKKPKLGGKIDDRMRRCVFEGLFGGTTIFNERDEEKIIIDDEEFLKSETKKIAHKVLTTCNFYHKKSESSSNPKKIYPIPKKY